jgi:hypothetical protein
MASYCVNFYRVLLSSDGYSFRCLQGKIDVPEVESSTQAAEIASRRFEALHRIPDWRIHADAREVVGEVRAVRSRTHCRS